MFRYASSVYGQTVLVGASWDLIWWFVGAGAAFIVVHAVVKAIAGSRTKMLER
ncbi:MAG TPA: hypothetical protein VKI44_28630 [Acetobacteraceae bacterium]|nr:hypothetical protein [Acetobacteraceae bacterium]